MTCSERQFLLPCELAQNRGKFKTAFALFASAPNA